MNKSPLRVAKSIAWGFSVATRSGATEEKLMLLSNLDSLYTIQHMILGAYYPDMVFR